MHFLLHHTLFCEGRAVSTLTFPQCQCLTRGKVDLQRISKWSNFLVRFILQQFFAQLFHQNFENCTVLMKNTIHYSWKMGVGRIYVEWGSRRNVETGYYNLFNVSQKTTRIFSKSPRILKHVEFSKKPKKTVATHSMS